MTKPLQNLNVFDWKLDFPEVLNPLVFADNQKVENLNLQIDALNKQITVINHHLTNEDKIITLLHFQANIAQNQVDLIKLQIQKLEKEIEKIYGTVSIIKDGIVSEQDMSFVYKINSINNGINDINCSVKSINETIKIDNPEMGFDIVIGNPPYVQIKWLSDKDNFKNKSFKSFTASGDLYCLFYEQADKLLKKKGSGSFITSNKWLRSNYGKSLRDYLINESNPCKLIDFGGNKIFDTATVDTNILFWANDGYSKRTNAVLVDKHFDRQSDLSKYISDKLQPYEFKKDDSWLLLSNFEIELKNNLENKFKSIKNHNINLYYGILTGANGTFIIDEATRQKLIKLDIMNSEIIKPIIRGKDLDNYSFKFANVYLLNSHNGTDKLNRVNVPKNFPTLIQYFDEFGEKFKTRGEKGKEWYNLRSCSYLEEFLNPKIIYADIVQDRGKFYFDNEGYYTNDTAFIIVGENLKYYTLIFNSKAFSYLYKKFYSGGGLGDKGLRFKKEFIEKIPMPTIDLSKKLFYDTILDIVQFIKRVTQKINSEIPNSHISEVFEEVVDALVFELYFPEAFEEKGIEIEKYAQEIFKPIEYLKEEEQIKTIQEAYQTLREKDNPFRNQIKLMKIELKELLLPILSI